MSRLSISAYARHRGVSHVAVIKAIKAGRIHKNKDGTITVTEADAAWDGNTREVAGDTASNKPDTPLIVSPASSGASSQPSTGGPSYAQSRAVKEAYLARLAKLTFEEKTAQLVRIDNVKVTWFNVLRILRDQTLNLPDRLAPLLAAETDPRQVREVLDEAFRQILEDAANNMASIKTE